MLRTDSREDTPASGISGTPAPDTPRDDTAVPETEKRDKDKTLKALGYRCDKGRPNIYAGMHHGRMQDEYSLLVHANLLSGEDKYQYVVQTLRQVLLQIH
jgi:hypothetical protein